MRITTVARAAAGRLLTLLHSPGWRDDVGQDTSLPVPTSSPVGLEPGGPRVKHGAAARLVLVSCRNPRCQEPHFRAYHPRNAPWATAGRMAQVPTLPLRRYAGSRDISPPLPRPGCTSMGQQVPRSSALSVRCSRSRAVRTLTSLTAVSNQAPAMQVGFETVGSLRPN